MRVAPLQISSEAPPSPVLTRRVSTLYRGQSRLLTSAHQRL